MNASAAALCAKAAKAAVGLQHLEDARPPMPPPMHIVTHALGTTALAFNQAWPVRRWPETP